MSLKKLKASVGWKEDMVHYHVKRGKLIMSLIIDGKLKYFKRMHKDNYGFNLWGNHMKYYFLTGKWCTKVWHQIYRSSDNFTGEIRMHEATENYEGFMYTHCEISFAWLTEIRERDGDCGMRHIGMPDEYLQELLKKEEK